MQDELAAEHPDLPIRLVIVNEAGHEDGLDDLYEVTDLPVLQDDEIALVWDTWEVTWRDVWVLDEDNRPAAIFNLTEHDLGDSEEYSALYELLVETAGG